MTASTRALVLIGPMGAGKTSIGRRVAKALRVPFYDSDIAVVREHGPIETIFADHGEARFREWERDAVLAGLVQGGVVALGGGAVLDETTRTALAAHRVVLLTVEPRVVAGRVRDSTRPLLQDGDAIDRWTQIMDARRPIYEALADATFDTSHGPLQHVTDAIVAWARTADDPARQEQA
jgi:shikimate kinase